MRRILLGWIALAGSAAGADLPPTDLLARIRTQMSQVLTRLPDYTCRETIQRSVQAARGHAFESRDILRVDVAYLGGHESYAWPGSARFGDQSLREMIPGGAIATGNFGMLGKAVFATDAATFTYSGASVVNGRIQVRYDYRVPVERSVYLVRYGKRGAIVAYNGWFTADTNTYDVVAFEVDAEEIPKDLDTREGRERIEYARIRIAGSDYLLPQSSETVLVGSDGEINRNQITFMRCRQYTGESTLTFAEPGEIPASAPPPAPPQRLPRGLELQVRLVTPIQRGSTAIGDTVQGEITREVRRPVRIPKGAAVTLRVTRMDTVMLRNTRFHVIAFDVLNVKTGAEQYEVENARLETAGGAGPYFVSREGTISLGGRTLEILPGLQMRWKIR